MMLLVHSGFKIVLKYHTVGSEADNGKIASFFFKCPKKLLWGIRTQDLIKVHGDGFEFGFRFEMFEPMLLYMDSNPGPFGNPESFSKCLDIF